MIKLKSKHTFLNILTEQIDILFSRFGGSRGEKTSNISHLSNCQDGDSLNIWDYKKKKASMISICGAERPKPMRLFNKNRDKIFQWRSMAGFGQQDGFQAYITVKGCNSPTRDTTTTSTTTET